MINVWYNEYAIPGIDFVAYLPTIPATTGAFVNQTLPGAVFSVQVRFESIQRSQSNVEHNLLSSEHTCMY
jgi:hypothetical protein